MLNEIRKLTNGNFSNVNHKAPFRCYIKATFENFEKLKDICIETDLDDDSFKRYLNNGYDYLFLDSNGVLWMNNLFTGEFSGITGGYGCCNEAVFKNNKWKKIT